MHSRSCRQRGYEEENQLWDPLHRCHMRFYWAQRSVWPLASSTSSTCLSEAARVRLLTAPVEARPLSFRLIVRYRRSGEVFFGGKAGEGTISTIISSLDCSCLCRSWKPCSHFRFGQISRGSVLTSIIVAWHALANSWIRIFALLLVRQQKN